jgi:excinuclease ABC subunit A
MELKGVRTHNLASVDAVFPLGKWTSVCGVSGSGKTSLVFDTLHAEAERRWLSTLPVWRRNLSDAMPRPPMDGAAGLVPTAALRQETVDGGPWSTLSSLAGVHEPLVALWAAASVPFSPATGEPMRKVSAPEAAERCLAEVPGERIQVLFRPEEALPGVWVRRGFVRGVVEGEAVELERLPPEAPVEGLRIVVDRLRAEPKHALRLSEAILTAYRLGGELCSLEAGESGALGRYSFSGVPRCLATGRTAPRASPALFSRRSATGACPVCRGAGVREGRICEACRGSGLREEAGWFRIGPWSLPDLMERTADEVGEIASSPRWAELSDGPCGELVDEIRRRLGVLRDLGLGYLPLGRTASSLSQGEERRTRLAALVGSPLAGLAYVLDEPTTGLHPSDLPRVHALLAGLRDQGATLVVVEHDLRSLSVCDKVLETGPGPGPGGGRILFDGRPGDLAGADTPSGRWLAGRGRPPERRPAAPRGRVVLDGASGRNLREVRLEVPLGAVTVVSGVSGAGKSTLVLDTLAPALRRKLTGKGEVLPFASLSIEGELHEVSVVEPGGEWIRSPRSTVATLSGMLDDLRALFASLPDAKLQGWTAARFSPNVRGGRCEVCDGIGEEKVELHLLPDAWVPCSRCQGARFDSQTLSVRWKGLSIADVLALDLERAKTVFANHPRLGPLAKRLCDAGLGHLSGGRRSDSLSGGEALRLRLASAVGGNTRKRTMWILDEPTRGLHPQDTLRLVAIFDELAATGDTVVAISHDPVLMSRCDRVAELGPGAGAAGGRLLYAGPPAGLAAGQFPSSESVGFELGA